MKSSAAVLMLLFVVVRTTTNRTYELFSEPSYEPSGESPYETTTKLNYELTDEPSGEPPYEATTKLRYELTDDPFTETTNDPTSDLPTELFTHSLVQPVTTSTQRPEASSTAGPDQDPAGCIRNTPTGCQARADGDYQPCYNLCQLGYYMTCSNNILYVRDCPLGWYAKHGAYFTAKLVFDPQTRSCQFKTPTCPRELDQHVIS